MTAVSSEKLRRVARAARQNPVTMALCACKKVEIGLLGRRASGRAYNPPLGIDIELTNLCNLRCAWCDTQFYADRSVRRREFPFEVFQRVVPQLRGINRVMFCGGGETLTYQHAAEAVALTKQHVPTVYMHSNGVLLHGQRATALARSGLDELRVSIDGADEDVVQRIRGTSLSRLLANLKEFSALGDTPIATVSVISKVNWESLMRIPDMLREVDNVRRLYFQPVEVDFLGWEGKEYYIEPDAFRQLRDVVLEKCRRYGLETNIDDPEFDPLFAKPFDLCEYPFFGYITMNYEGFLAPCCRLTNVAHMGDLKVQSFGEIWDGPAFRRLRELMLEGRYPSYCHARCRYRVRMDSTPSAETPGRLRQAGAAPSPGGSDVALQVGSAP